MSALVTLTMLLASGGMLDVPVGEASPSEDAAVEPLPAESVATEDPAEGESLDDELFRALGGEDDAAEETPSDDDAPDAAPADDAPADDAEMPDDGGLDEDALDDELFRDLDQGEDLGEEGENPLVRLGERMRQVEELIAAKRSGPETQDMQREIAEELAKLIEQAKQQQQQQQSSQSQSQQETAERRQVKQPMPRSGGQQPQPGSQAAAQAADSPAEDSTERLDPDRLEKVDMAHMNGLAKRIWGQLPDKEQREQMLQLSIEQFLPKYSESIEQYFQRLAEQEE